MVPGATKVAVHPEKNDDPTDGRILKAGKNDSKKTTRKRPRSIWSSSRNGSMIRVVTVLSAVYLVHVLVQQALIANEDNNGAPPNKRHPHIDASFTNPKRSVETKKKFPTRNYNDEKKRSKQGAFETPRRDSMQQQQVNRKQIEIHDEVAHVTPYTRTQNADPAVHPLPPKEQEVSVAQKPKDAPLSSKSTSTTALVSNSMIIPPTSANTTLPSPAEQQQVREYLQNNLKRSFLPLAAVLETPETNLKNDKKPLPLRSKTTLTTVSYPNSIQSCNDIPDRWPVSHAQELDTKYGPNFGHLWSMYSIRHAYANTTCPVDADPFLPWIHDIFVDATGTSLQVIAHNKRRCRRDPRFYGKDIENLEPQVTLMQSVPIQKLDGEGVDASVSQEWSRRLESILPPDWNETPRSPKEHWYRLAPIQDADVESRETRFLCQFFTLRPTFSSTTTNVASGVEKVVVGETWSTYPYNYEHANYQHRRGQMANPMLTRPLAPEHVDGIHNEQVWNAILLFSCPIPLEVQQQSNNNKKDSSIPSFYVDLVPVRTPPRENVTGYALPILGVSTFDPVAEWGDSHVLPPVSQSGRWANIPICPSPIKEAAPAVAASTTAGTTNETTQAAVAASQLSIGDSTNGTTTNKPHFIVGCLWASAVFSERGSSTWDTHTIERLLEWLTYHLDIAGFDHMVVYDNTGAHTNMTSLQSATDMFPSSKVTRIPWGHRVCNNNGYGDANAGERSSQYAAEASCRVRYGPTTEWMAFFDTDEYLIPSGNWSSIREWLQVGVTQGTIAPNTHILSLYETKAFLNYRFTEQFVDDEDEYCHSSCRDCDCRVKRPDATYLEAFCEPHSFPREFPKTKQKMKQIYRPSFVLNHFVHYATVTDFVHTRPKFPRVVGWPYERRAREFSEAYMLHTKTRLPHSTSGWNTTRSRCLVDRHKCPVGLPFPYYQGMNTTNNTAYTSAKKRRDRRGHLLTEFGVPYNCWELQKVQENLAGRLHAVLDPLREKWKAAVGPNGVIPKQ